MRYPSASMHGLPDRLSLCSYEDGNMGKDNRRLGCCTVFQVKMTGPMFRLVGGFHFNIVGVLRYCHIPCLKRS